MPGPPLARRPRPARAATSASSSRGRSARHDPERLLGVRVRPAVRRPGQRRPARASPSPTPTRRTSRRSSPTWAACRWPSSSPRRGSGSSRRRRSTSGSRAGSTCPARARPTSRSASGRCAARSCGATSSSTRPARRLFERLAVFVGGLRPRAGGGGGRRQRTADARRRRARRARVARGPEPRPERRGGRRAPVLDARADPRVRARTPRGVGRRRRRQGSATPARTSRSRQELAPELTGDAPARHARPARARAREPPRRHRLGRRARRRRGRARDHRRRSGGSGRSAATCARRARCVDDADRPPVVRRRAGAAARQGARGAGRDHLLARRGRRGPRRLRGRARDLAGASATGARSRTPPTTSRSCFTMGVLSELPPDARAARGRPARRGARRSIARWATTPARPTCTGESGSSTTSRTTTPPAAPAFEAALALYRKLGDRTQEALVAAPARLGAAQARRDSTRRAARSAAGLRLFAEAGDVAGVTLGLDDLAAVAVGGRRPPAGRPAVGPRPAHPGLVRHRPRGRRRERRSRWRRGPTWPDA